MARKAVLALAVVGALAASTVAAVPASASTTCDIKPYGLIGDYWESLGGASSIIGCPTRAEYSLPNRNGRRQNFDNGQIAWSPDQGGKMIVAAYGAKVSGKPAVVLRWGPTDPFHYDYFKITVKSDAPGQSGVGRIDNQPATRGREVFWPPAGRNAGGSLGHYSFSVMGCDNKFPTDTCRQGWTIWVSADA
jgi:hypothetical protein